MGIKYNSIFIIVNRLTKITYFIPYKEVSITKELIYIFIRFISINYKLPRDIIFNKGIIFIFKFQKAFITKLKINYKVNIVYYS